MSIFLSTWPRKIASTLALTIILVIGGLIVDPAYMNNPIGEDLMGVTAEDGYPMPATSESTLIADGIDPIQIDLKSELGDFAGEVEVLAPDGRILLSKRFALRKYPSSFIPNPSKWQSFLAPSAGKGSYKVRLTQEQPGRAKVFFYQGPFLMRMLILPLIAAFLILVINFTVAKPPAKAGIEA